MGTGDGMPGNVRVVREDTEGNIVRVFGPEANQRLDTKNENTTAEEKLYLNTSISSSKGKPAGAEEQVVPNAIWESGEVLKIQHKANSSFGSSKIDYDQEDAFEIGAVSVDLNRGNKFPEKLTSADTELSADVDESTSDYVTFFKYTVPDRQRLYLAGVLGAAAVEN